MSWVSVDFTYMPSGSFTVLPGTKEPYFLDAVPDELKQRMLAEWPEYVKRMEAKHAQGRYDSSDLI